MKILVAVKRVIDPYVKIRVKPDSSGVETQQVKHAINPFDEIAVEEALRLMDQKIATEVVAVTIGTDQSQETLRHAMALGVNRGILVQTDQSYCSLNIAKILQRIVMDEAPDVVLLGKQAIDNDSNQTAQMLAALLNWPQATFASAIEVKNNVFTITRETDTGSSVLSIEGPLVISTDLRLNEPRYASLPNIMKAKQKPLSVVSLESLHLNLKEYTQVLSVKTPPVRRAGVKVDSVSALITQLRHEAKVI